MMIATEKLDRIPIINLSKIAVPSISPSSSTFWTSSFTITPFKPNETIEVKSNIGSYISDYSIVGRTKIPCGNNSNDKLDYHLKDSSKKQPRRIFKYRLDNSLIFIQLLTTHLSANESHETYRKYRT